MKHISISIYIILISCYNLEFQKKDIIPNQWQGQKIRVAKLGKDFKKLIRHHKVFSKISSTKSMPYRKFTDKEFKIVGFYEYNKKNYLVIKDNKQRIFKLPCKKNALPSFIFFVETFENAKNLIGTNIWLNDVFDQKSFLTNFPKNFVPFQNVYVKDIVSFQNSNAGHPIWLKVVAKNGEDAIVRHNINGKRVGVKDHYFNTDPFPKNWGYEINNKIKNRIADVGMTSKQVQIALGYPDKIINTSSIHGISEQWMYHLKNKKTYYQFEYDTLIYINN